MKIRIPRRKGGYPLWYLVPAVLSAAGLTCSTSMEQYYTTSNGMEQLDGFGRLVVKMGRSLSADRLAAAAIAVIVFLLLYEARKYRFSAGDRAVALLFAAAFAGMHVAAQSYQQDGNLNVLFLSGFLCLRTLLRLAGVAVPVYALALLAFHWLDGIVPEEKESQETLFGRSFWLAAGFVFLCWLPYLILMFPGTSNADTATQVAQFFGENSWTRKMSAVRGPDIFQSNHFPYFTTLVFGSFVWLGLRLGNAAIGVALYNVLQMLLMASTMTAVWFYLRRWGLPRRAKRAGILFTALFPLYPMYAVCMLKDVAFGMFCLQVTMFLCEVVRTSGEALRKKSFCAGFAVSVLLMMFFRNQGVYIMAIVTVAVLICYRRRFLGIFCALILPVLLFQMVWIRILLPAWNVAPGGRQEMLGVLFQQTARCVRDYPEDVTKEEREAINRVIRYNKLAERYNPNKSDPVKFMFRQDCTAEDLKEYLGAWFSMFLRHPGSYIQAVLNNCCGFFYLPNEGGIYYSSYYNKKRWAGMELEVKQLFLSDGQVAAVHHMQAVLRRIPLIGVLFSAASYSWLVIFFYLNMLRKKAFGHFLSGLVLLISTGILVVCPANGNVRYVIPMIIGAPLLVGLCMTGPGGRKKKCI